MNPRRLSFVALFSGVLGGGLMVAVAAVVIALTGGLGSSTKTVTVREAPIVAANA